MPAPEAGAWRCPLRLEAGALPLGVAPLGKWGAAGAGLEAAALSTLGDEADCDLGDTADTGGDFGDFGF